MQSRENCNRLQFSHWTKIQTLRFPSLCLLMQVPQQEDVHKPLKLGFQETKETQTRNLGTHHVLITPAKVGDLCLSSVSLLYIPKTVNVISFPACALSKTQELHHCSHLLFLVGYIRGAHCNAKNNGIKMKLICCFLSYSGL